MNENGITDKLKLRIAQKEEDLTNQTQKALDDMAKRLNATLNTGLTTIEGDIKKQLNWSLKLVSKPLIMASVFLLLLTFAVSWGMGTILKQQTAKMIELQQEADYFREMNLTGDLEISQCDNEGKSQWCAKVDTTTTYGDGYHIIQSK